MKKYLSLLTLAVLAFPVFAQNNIEIDPQTCEPVKKVLFAAGEHKKIYPYVPVPTNIIDCKLRRLEEGSTYKTDLREITAAGLMKANTKNQPWGGSYWPLNMGQIGNTYQDKNFDVLYGALNGLEMLSWKYNYNKYENRKAKVHPKIYELDEKDLAKLSPSEKYDLLLGDTNFDLTNRVWNYVQTYGEKKSWGFLTSIDMPAGYKIPDNSSSMATWEGICHGWAVAAGHTPRPEKTVWVTLPNGKKMPFYPNDIKALISIMWANSTIQDAVIVEGLRCNQKRPDKDEHGRFIDTEIDQDDKSLLPRCADVHPAVYHSSIVNILGVEGRSFVVDKSSKASIANQPVAGYEYTYYNPENGKDGSLEASALSVANYPKDPFKDARNVDTRYIVGVAMTLKYTDWENPVMHETNYASDDKISDMKFNYDLELDENFKIIGGQWRVSKDGSSRLIRNTTHQPDFFWIVPRNYKSFFKENTSLPAWDFARSTLPPKEFAPAAKSAHSFMYEVSAKYSHPDFAPKCKVVPLKKSYGPAKEVDCSFNYNRPQPLINVVNKLIEESRL